VKVLITGIPGSGKSTVGVILASKGYFYADSDTTEGLALWVNSKTKKQVPKNPKANAAWYEEHSWNMIPENLKNYLEEMEKIHENVIVAGMTSNITDVFHLFDKVLTLKVDHGTARKRMIARSGSKADLESIETVFGWAESYEKGALDKGATVIDANQKPSNVVLEVLKQIRPELKFVSRAGEKIRFALDQFGVNPANLVCADFGCNAGGFTDCLLQNRAAKVYAIDTGYGALEWKIRQDPRVVTLERTNAMHVELPELMDLIVIDVAWTQQNKILPSAMRNLKPGGRIISLVKTHYEANSGMMKKGLVQPEFLAQIEAKVRADIENLGLKCSEFIKSPLQGKSGGNTEYLVTILKEDEQI
jgi:23S rRNA (cytidine1920-2'-O)/16S rRNA (cytidine1409-2'-O)-methyltransferase